MIILHDSDSGAFGPAYAKLLESCPKLRLSPPWNLFDPDVGCYAPVTDPERALAALRQDFDDRLLQQAGILQQTARGPRLHPALCNPVGALVALRSSADEKPFDLLTARGCLSGRRLPVFAALLDGWTVAALDKSQQLFATPRIREVALLRALGLPATLTWGLHQRALPPLRTLAELFDTTDAVKSRFAAMLERAESVSSPAAEQAVACPEVSNERYLVLLGWQLLNRSRRLPPWLVAIAAQLAEVASFGDLAFSNISVWWPSSEQVEGLTARLKFQDADLVGDYLREQSERGYDYDLFTDTEKPFRREQESSPTNCVEAHAQLIACLAEERQERCLPEKMRDALAQYETLVHRDVIEPMQIWALHQPSPIVRSAGLKLADVAWLVHRLSPQLHDLQLHELHSARLEDTELLPSPVHKQYVDLCKQYSAIAKAIRQWRP
jgi:hypothetical protein